MQQVRIDGERCLAAFILGDLNALALSESEQIRAGLKFPVAPRGDDFDVRVQAIVAELKTDLVIPFTGCTVTNGISAFSPLARWVWKLRSIRFIDMRIKP